MNKKEEKLDALGFWRGMPEYNSWEESFTQCIVHFRDAEAVKDFEKMMGQTTAGKIRRASMWYPKRERQVMRNHKYLCDPALQPRYPIYIPSRGRFESRKTLRALERMGIDYRIVIEKEELDLYSSVIDSHKILVLPHSGKGLVESRNWIRQHSMDEGHTRHWQLDDNISCFYRANNNLKTEVLSGNIFVAAESFVDRFTNVMVAGFEYESMVPREQKRPPFRFNCRIYSCSLIDNSCRHWWRGIYNDDTDLCLRVFKDGDCTILFNAFLAGKKATMTVAGGNTELYKENGRKLMAESLQKQHPDCVQIMKKWGRWQHLVDYSRWKKNKPILRDGMVIEDRANNFGMRFGEKP